MKPQDNNLYAEVSEYKEYLDSIQEFFDNVDVTFLDEKIKEIYDLNIGNTDCVALLLSHHQEEIIENHLRKIRPFRTF